MARVKVFVSPEGRFGRRQIDPLTLLDSGFVRSVADHLEGETELFALFPSAQLSEFGAKLGLTHSIPGAAYFEQGGTALANSKAVFRAVAAGAGVPTSPGAVCQTAAEAANAMQRLIDQGHDVMVKKAQHGGAAGNEIVLRTGSPVPTNIGGRHVHRLTGPDAVGRYWDERWEWASAGGTYPAIVEGLLDVIASCYAEYEVTDCGVELAGTGRLSYMDRMLMSDTLTPAPTEADPHHPLVAGAGALARSYQALGYRGYLCADAVATVNGKSCSPK
ncbi:hypothetical protein [Kribbella sp. CA-294648]|uniref:hypothetical protein n=1 Tax=Kribbella sp. CA-294648 TaxID=3239948 RepID=UPI003D945888